MKNLFRSLFGASPPPAPATPAAAEAARDDHPMTIEEGSDNAMRRQLVQVLLRDLLRKHGIAPHWIELHMLVVSRSSRGSGLYVRLIVRHWDERLMNYASALQNALLTDIARFEPRASEWLHGISWQFEMTDSCPYTTLPGKAFWAETAAPTTPVMPVILASTPAQAVKRPTFAPSAQVARPSKESEALEDLQLLFQVRDKDLGKHSDGMAVGYEKTQPSPL
jgi:hypothetical protein